MNEIIDDINTIIKFCIILKIPKVITAKLIEVRDKVKKYDTRDNN